VLVYLAIHSLIAVTARHPTIVGLGTPFTCAFRQTIAMKTLSSYYKEQASEPTDACSPKEEPNRISSSLDIENDTKAIRVSTVCERWRKTVSTRQEEKIRYNERQSTLYVGYSSGIRQVYCVNGKGP
jgi:hypothetical protein